MKKLESWKIRELIEEGKMPADFIYEVRGVRGCSEIYKKAKTKFSGVKSCITWAIRKGATYVIVEIIGVKEE